MATAPIATTHAPGSAPFDDVCHPDLYVENRWQEPFRQMRADGGIHYIEDARFGPYWALTGYKPIVHVEALPAIYSSEGPLGGITVAGRGQDNLASFEMPMPMFIAMDPPKHTGQRRTVAPAFGPTPVAEMKAEATRRTAEVLDSLPVGESFDWVDRVSMELTTQMLAKLFDFPWDQRRNLTRWSDVLGDIENFETEESRKHRMATAMEMGAAFHALWESKKGKERTDDLISMMLHSDAMKDMDDGEFMGNLILLIVGGNDTTRNSMSAYAYGMHQFPDQRAKLEGNPALIPNAVQEIIRWQTPLAHMRRTATQDADLMGHHIKKGDKLAMWYISGNRDESVFTDGESIDIERENARRHLAFGYGIHRCVGARVAELQLQVLLEQMALRRLRPVVTGQPEFVPACFVHGYRHMDVMLERY
ncbi:MAG: cytochrome P450 [Sphingopyxis sp.]